MKKLVLILVCLPAIAFAQDKKIIDSLLKSLSTAKTDSQIVKIYNKVAYEYIDGNAADGLVYANNALALSKKAGFEKGEAKALLYRGMLMVNLLKPVQGKADFDNSIKICKKINDLTGLAHCCAQIGVILRTNGDKSGGLAYFQQAADAYEKVNDQSGTAACLVLLANNYNLLNLFDKALVYYKKAYEIRVKIKEDLTAAQTLAGIGITYRNMVTKVGDKNMKTAISYLLQSRQVFVRRNSKLNLALVDRETGMAYLYDHQYQNAITYLLESEGLLNKLNYKRELGLLYCNIGVSYTNLKQFGPAKTYLEKGLAASKAENYEEQIIECYEGIYNYYKALNNDKMSLLYHEKWKSEKDSLDRKSNFDKLSELTTKYEAEKKEQQIILLSKENTIQKLSIAGRNKTIGIIIGLFALSGIIAAWVYNRNKFKQKTLMQQQLLKQQALLTTAVIDAEEKERTRIASDLHDGVGQLFSAVRMNLNGLLDRVKMERDEDRYLAEKTVALVEESCKEVRSISHQMMPNMLLRSGIASDVKSFIEKIDSETLKVEVEANGFKNKLESNVETVLYRVIQETVNNVIKHAKATTLKIVLNRNKAGITAVVTDNGIGFDITLKDDFDGIGLKNIATRIEYLRGSVVYESAPGRGTKVTIVVPVD